MNIDLVAINNIKREIDKLISKRTKKVKELKEKPFTVVANQEEYKSVHELQNDYGCGLLTRKQLEMGMKAFEQNESNENIRLVNTEINLLCEIYQALEDKQNVQD